MTAMSPWKMAEKSVSTCIQVGYSTDKKLSILCFHCVSGIYAAVVYIVCQIGAGYT